MIWSVAAISIGAALGALLRWQLGLWLNAIQSIMPLGTLAANLIGGYLVGLAFAFFAFHPSLPPQWRLFAITGFLGGLTTFSTFSSEVVSMLHRGQPGAALLTAGMHMLGSFALTALGILTFEYLFRR
ncbi:fluoride efflux transporter CrcB [Burkholderiaceae bacterium DAT-1]|nr:fluoride efflux transporter CrcB [Burkholderiaceae bacterium DAT-1]